jgi:Tfp pilus assembly protein PilO
VNVTSTRAVCASLAGISLLGYLFVVRPLESTIALRYGDLEAARAALQRDLVTAHRLHGLEREAREADRDLAPLHLHDSRAAIVDRFLHATQQVAEHDGVRIQTVAANTATPVHGVTPVFEETPFDVTIRGSYSAALHAMRDLNERVAAAQITVTAIGNAQRVAGADPQLTATLHITLLREADAPPSRPHPV